MRRDSGPSVRRVTRSSERVSDAAEQVNDRMIRHVSLQELGLVTTDGYCAYADVIHHVLAENGIYSQVAKTW